MSSNSTDCERQSDGNKYESGAVPLCTTLCSDTACSSIRGCNYGVASAVLPDSSQRKYFF